MRMQTESKETVRVWPATSGTRWSEGSCVQPARQAKKFAFLAKYQQNQSQTRSKHAMFLSTTAYRGVPGSAKKQVWRPNVRAWVFWEPNALYWREYLRHCWDFSAPGALCPHLGTPLTVYTRHAAVTPTYGFRQWKLVLLTREALSQEQARHKRPLTLRFESELPQRVCFARRDHSSDDEHLLFASRSCARVEVARRGPSVRGRRQNRPTFFRQIVPAIGKRFLRHVRHKATWSSLSVLLHHVSKPVAMKSRIQKKQMSDRL